MAFNRGQEGKKKKDGELAHLDPAPSKDDIPWHHPPLPGLISLFVPTSSTSGAQPWLPIMVSGDALTIPDAEARSGPQDLALRRGSINNCDLP